MTFHALGRSDRHHPEAQVTADTKTYSDRDLLLQRRVCQLRGRLSRSGRGAGFRLGRSRRLTPPCLVIRAMNVRSPSVFGYVFPAK